jgi:hypothetical protein
MDGVQQLRLMFGIAKDLKDSGQWDSFLTHSTLHDTLVIHPMEMVGLLLDPPNVGVDEFANHLPRAEARIGLLQLLKIPLH